MKFLQISVPKAGTHLFENMTLAKTASLPLVFGGIDRLFPSEFAIKKRFTNLQEGRYKAHLPHFEGVEQLLEQFDHAIFISRDPRDIIVSMAYYIENSRPSVFNWRMPNGKRLNEHDLAYRIDYLIDNMHSVFERFDPWMDVANIEKFSYEDYVTDPHNTYARLEKMGLGSTAELEKRSKVKAYTFRVGTTGNWEHEFTEFQKQKANMNFSKFIDRWGGNFRV